MGRLDGKIALVTGGSSGIGLATASEFVKEGAYVFITGRRSQQLAEAVESMGRNAVSSVQADVSNLEISTSCSHGSSGRRADSMSYLRTPVLP